MKTIAIVGAGCSGLAAIKTCLEENLIPVCFERSSDIGGLWNYSETVRNDRGSIYKSLVINTSKEMMAFSDFPIPEDFPPFLPHEYVLKYFRMYAERFGLLEHVTLDTSVLSISKCSDYHVTGRWAVTVKTEGAPPLRRIFDGVMVCSGHHTVPYTPKFTGTEDFKGTVMHSHDYKESDVFSGKRVLIVGIGNSAVDIAVDVSRVASKVFLSTRRGSWVIGRTGFWGLPADLLANNRFVFSLPLNLLQWVVEKQANFKVDHEFTGLKPQHGLLEAHPTINDELPFRLLSGKISIKADVKTFFQDGVEFSDDTLEDVDVVILATGYDYRLDFVNEEVMKIENNKTTLYKFMYPPNLSHPTFAAIGLVQPIGAIMPVSEMQCRWFTKAIKGESTLPPQDEMLKDVARRFSLLDSTYVKSRRHNMQTFWIEYMDDVANQIGAKPHFKTLLLRDPALAFQCFFGPCVPAQYRLTGPGKWEGARQVIMDAVSRATKGATSRRTSTKKNVTSSVRRNKGLMILLYAIVFFVIFFSWCLDSFPLFSALSELPDILQKNHVDRALG